MTNGNWWWFYESMIERWLHDLIDQLLGSVIGWVGDWLENKWYEGINWQIVGWVDNWIQWLDKILMIRWVDWLERMMIENRMLVYTIRYMDCEILGIKCYYFNFVIYAHLVYNCVLFNSTADSNFIIHGIYRLWDTWNQLLLSQYCNHHSQMI
jgi:hypothetical protein